MATITVELIDGLKDRVRDFLADGAGLVIAQILVVAFLRD